MSKVRAAEEGRKIAKDLLKNCKVPGGPNGFVAEVVAPTAVHIGMDLAAIVAAPVVVAICAGSLISKGAKKVVELFD